MYRRGEGTNPSPSGNGIWDQMKGGQRSQVQRRWLNWVLLGRLHGGNWGNWKTLGLIRVKTKASLGREVLYSSSLQFSSLLRCLLSEDTLQIQVQVKACSDPEKSFSTIGHVCLCGLWRSARLWVVRLKFDVWDLSSEELGLLKIFPQHSWLQRPEFSFYCSKDTTMATLTALDVG